MVASRRRPTPSGKRLAELVGLDGARPPQRQSGGGTPGHRLCDRLDGAARGPDRRRRQLPAELGLRRLGRRQQQDCVDEANNTTSYLLVLTHHVLIQHHLVERPFAKDSLSHWTHWAALIKEKGSGEEFAID
jgi:hypothetical protein